MATEARFPPNAQTQDRPTDFRFPPIAGSARPHHRRHQSPVCISCFQSCQLQDLISILCASPERHTCADKCDGLFAIILRIDTDSCPTFSLHEDVSEVGFTLKLKSVLVAILRENACQYDRKLIKSFCVHSLTTFICMETNNVHCNSTTLFLKIHVYFCISLHDHR
jgi:hypothetical protein